LEGLDESSDKHGIEHKDYRPCNPLVSSCIYKLLRKMSDDRLNQQMDMVVVALMTLRDLVAQPFLEVAVRPAAPNFQCQERANDSNGTACMSFHHGNRLFWRQIYMVLHKCEDDHVNLRMEEALMVVRTMLMELLLADPKWKPAHRFVLRLHEYEAKSIDGSLDNFPHLYSHPSASRICKQQHSCEDVQLTQLKSPSAKVSSSFDPDEEVVDTEILVVEGSVQQWTPSLHPL
jgi:hypothetical protein